MSILRSLYRYAEAHSLDKDAYFKEIEIEWLLCVKQDLSVSLLRIEGPRKGRGVPYHLPIMLTRSSGIQPNFPSDNPLYVLGMKFEEERKRADPDWNIKCHDAYITRMERAAEASGDDDLHLVVKALRKHQGEFYKLPGASDVLKIDWVCPATQEGDSWLPISERPRVRNWWIMNYPIMQRMVAGVGTCMVTGKEAPLARIHPRVTGIEGGKSTGVTLVTWNVKSGESFGNKQGMNAPISVHAAIMASQALSQILSRQSGKRRSIEIEHGLHMAFIPKKEEEEKAAQYVLSLLDPIEDDFLTTQDTFAPRDRKVWKSHRALFNATGIGTLPSSPDTAVDILVTQLRSSSARIEVLRFEQESFGDVFDHLKAYFRDLEIYDPWAKEVRSDFTLKTVWPKRVEGAKKEKVFPLTRGLLDALKTDMKDPESGTRPETAAGMFLSAIEGRPLPREIVPLALVAAARSARDGRGIPVPVAALLKIYLNREYRRPESHLRNRWMLQDPNYTEVNAMLNPKCTVTSYVIGRFLAVAERIQEIAIPGVTASVVKRLYDGMSKSPASVMPGVLRDVNHHIHKIKKAKPGLAFWCRKILEDVMALLPAEKDKACPRTLDLQDQVMFGLGYHHQRTDFFVKKESPDTEPEKSPEPAGMSQ